MMRSSGIVIHIFDRSSITSTSLIAQSGGFMSVYCLLSISDRPHQSGQFALVLIS